MPKSPYFRSVFSGSLYFPKGESEILQLGEPFEGYGITLRKLLAELIQDGKEAELFNFNDFTLVETWLDYRLLEQLHSEHTNGHLYIVSYPVDKNNISRANSAQMEVPILVGFKKSGLTPQDLAGIDQHMSFVEQVEYVCRKFDPEHYSWTRSECLKDEDGLPYSYANLTTAGVFETYFMTYYNLIVA